MPYTIKQGVMKYKDPVSGEYVGINSVGGTVVIQSQPSGSQGQGSQESGSQSQPSGMTQAEKTALASFIGQMAQMIPSLAFSSETHNGASAVSAANAAVTALGGSGESEPITPTSYTVTKTLSHCTATNTASTVTEGSSYASTVSADSGYTLGTVTVTMGGTDITSSAYTSGTGAVSIASVTGNIVITATAALNTYTISKTLTHCTAANSASTITHGSSYSDTITADSEYSLGAVTVTMGGTDVTSTAYNSGTGAISIASVTGNIVITATASQTTYTVTNTLSNCASSNAATSAVEGSSYSATITASTGYSLASVSVTMGGTDVTSTAYNSGTGAVSIASVTGNIVVTATATLNTYTVTNTLSGCASSNAATSAAHGSSYSATITASTGYTLNTVTVTMGGTDVTTTAYNSGTGAVSIASVTGNIVVTATAAQIVYTITKTLSNCTSSNAATSTAHGSSYSATITASTGYAISAVSVTMGGTDITSTAYTSATGVISIASVTGNIEITATASALELSSISASFAQGNNTIYDNASLDDLKQYLTVTATYSDNSTATISASNYTLSGTLSAGTSTVTVSYGGKTDAFSVTVTAVPPSLASISASFSPGNNTIYTSTALNDLKQYLTVTATYSDTTTGTLNANDYTLSGTMDHGSQTITVTSGGKTATFTVTVHAVLPSGYTELTYIATDGSQYIDTQIQSTSVNHAEYEVMITALNSSDTALSSSDQAYRKGNHIFSGLNMYFPFFKGNSAGWQNEIAFNRLGRESGQNGESPEYNWNLNQRYVLSGFANNDLKVDGVTLFKVPLGSVTSSSAMAFFTYGGSASARKFRFRGRMYYAKLYDSSNVLIHDYIPCKNASNVAGLYDLVAETFLTSATESALIAGEVA